MDFRKTYAGPGRFGSGDPFAQLNHDTRQERDDRARQEPNASGKGVSRPTHSSLAKGGGDGRVLRNSFSARPSGRYNPLSQSVDLGPALRSTSQGGSNIPRQPAGPPQHHGAAPRQPPPTASAAAANAAREMLDLIDASQHREAMLLDQKRQLEANLHNTNLRCAELARGLQQATTALEAERAAVTRLRSERDEHVAELDRARSQALELQASGNVAMTTSEVCRAALSTAFKGTVSAIGSAHEELESALASQKKQELELADCKKRIAELEEQVQNGGQELEEARLSRQRLSQEMEELAGRLDSREDILNTLVESMATSAEVPRKYEAAVSRARHLKDRVTELELQLEGQGVDLATLRSLLAEYQAQMSRMEERLRDSSSGTSSPDGDMPSNLEAQVSELADERDQLEGDNLQLAANNEDLRRQNAGLKDQLQEALVAAAVATASCDRDASAEIARLNQEVAKITAQAHEWRQQAETASAQAKLVQEAAALAEAARARAEQAHEELSAARLVEAQELSLEAVQLRAVVTDLQDQVVATRRESQGARDQLNAAHANENALMQRILAGEAERQQLLQQIDTSNSMLSGLKKRLDDAVLQERELADLRGRLAASSREAEQQAKAAAAATARVASLEVEIQELREALRNHMERAGHEARMHERREQQLSALRQQVMEAEAQQLQAEKEISLLRAQVSVNDTLRARVDELQARLARVTLPKPCADAFAQVSGGGALAAEMYHVACGSSGGGAAPGCYLDPHDEALLAAHVARQSMVAGWLGAGGAPFGPDPRLVPGSLLDSYNAIPEDDSEEHAGGKRGRGRGAGGPRVRPLRFLVGLVVKGTLVAGGMACGLALGNPQAFKQAIQGGVGAARLRSQPGQAVVVEGIMLPSQ